MSLIDPNFQRGKNRCKVTQVELDLYDVNTNTYNNSKNDIANSVNKFEKGKCLLQNKVKHGRSNIDVHNLMAKWNVKSKSQRTTEKSWKVNCKKNKSDATEFEPDLLYLNMLKTKWYTKFHVNISKDDKENPKYFS